MKSINTTRINIWPSLRDMKMEKMKISTETVNREASKAMEKKCSNCFKIKPVEEFYVSRTKGPNRYQSRCKACNSEVVQGSRYRRQQKEFSNWVKGN